MTNVETCPCTLLALTSAKHTGSCPMCHQHYWAGEPIPTHDPRITWWRFTPKTFSRIARRWRPFDLEVGASTGDHMLGRWLGPGGLVENALVDPWPWFTSIYSHPPRHCEQAFIDRIQWALETTGGARAVVLGLSEKMPGGIHLQVDMTDGDGNYKRKVPYRAMVIG